uniref:CSON012829 protein n=1 Tax=Culicoides sonorensis TaxID=179676 RepID=A0A336MBW5_CULSO
MTLPSTTSTSFVVKMRQRSLYFKLVLFFNLLLIHSTITAPTTTGVSVDDDDETTSTTNILPSSTASYAINNVESVVTTAKISHDLDDTSNNKKIYDKTGTLSNNIKKIIDDTDIKSNEVVRKNDDDEEQKERKDQTHYNNNYAKNGVSSNKNNGSDSSSIENEKFDEVSPILSEIITTTAILGDEKSTSGVSQASTKSTSESSSTPIPTSIENVSERPTILSPGLHVPIPLNRSENIPLIIFETQNKSDPDTYIDVVSDKDTTLEITLTSDEASDSTKKEQNDFESQLISNLYTTKGPQPISALLDINNNNKEDEIKIKTTDKDSDTVFLISNTEVKMMESNPTPFPPINNNDAPNFNPISSIEDVVIDFAYNNVSSLTAFNGNNNLEPDIVLSSLNSYDNEYTRESMPLIRAPDSSYQESLSINFQENPIYVSRLTKESLNIHINTPTNISLPSNLTREGNEDLQLRNLSTPIEQYGGNTTIFLDADANSIFSGLDDFQTVVVACLLTLIPLILLAVLAVAIRCIWQKYHRDYDTGSVLLGEYNSECHQNAKPNESITVDIQKHQNNAVQVKDDTTNVANNSSNKPNSIVATSNTQQTIVGTDDNSNKCPNNCQSRNGSIIKMTMQNNHLIVETEERNDISRDARETKLTYTSPDKDGIFIVAATRGADQLESMKTNNILKAKQDEKCELHDRAVNDEEKRCVQEQSKEKVQIHSHPDLIQPIEKPEPIPISKAAQTGLTQSDSSLDSSNDSNQNYSYGTQVIYKKPNDLGKYRHRSSLTQSTTSTSFSSNSQLNGNLNNYSNSNNNNEKYLNNGNNSGKVASDENNSSPLKNNSNLSTSSPVPPLPDVVV